MVAEQGATELERKTMKKRTITGLQAEMKAKTGMSAVTKSTLLTALAAAALVAAPLAANAQQVTVVGEPCPLAVSDTLAVEAPQEGEAAPDAAAQPEEAAVEAENADAAGAENPDAAGAETVEGEAAPAPDAAAETQVTEFVLIGRAGEDKAVIRVMDMIGYVDAADLTTKMPELELDRFPQMEGIEQIPANSSGDRVVEMQNFLIEKGYLSGAADGQYGPGTANAVRTFQQASGLEETGNADTFTVMVMQAIRDGLPEKVEVTYPMYTTAEEKFARIISLTDADLEPYMDTMWRLSYDPFTGTGLINPSIDFGTFSVDGADIDRIQGEASLGIVLAKDDTGMLALIPAVLVDTTGSYRPYVQGVSLAAGQNVVSSDGGVSTGEVSGATLKESAYVPLTAEAIELLGSGEVTSIRINGKNKSYDIAFTADPAKLEAFAASAAASLEG